MFRKKIFSFLLAGAILLGSMLSAVVPRAWALDLTQSDLQSLANTASKMRNLTQQQATDAIDIASAIVDNVGISWLNGGEIDRLRAKGLDKQDMVTVLNTVKTAVNTNWGNLTSTDVSPQLNAAANLINQVVNNFPSQFKASLKERGLEENDLGSLITASLGLVNIQITSWSTLPKSDIEAVFNNSIANTTLSKQIVSSYGLNWDTVDTILNSLDSTQKSALQSILVSLGNWPAPAFVSAATSSDGTQVIITFTRSMASPAGKHAAFTVLVNGSSRTISSAALDSTITKKIILTLDTAVASGSTVTVSYTAGTVTAADGAKLSSFTAKTVNVLVPVSTSTVTVSQNTKDLAITNTTPAAEITIPSTVTNATINVGSLMTTTQGGQAVAATVPANITIKATTSVSASKPVEISIPQGVTISAAESDNWDGTINVPTVKENASVTVTADQGKTATVSTVIEVGFGDVPLTFDKAVKLIIPGQAGKDAGYYRGSTFTKITRTAENSQAWADANLQSGEDAKVDVGEDLVIWTKHFTKFVTYTQTTSGGGGGGGGGMTTGKPVYSDGAVISQNGATLTFPAGAVTSKVYVKIDKVSDASGLPLPEDSKLVSVVVNITKDKSADFAKPVTITLAYDMSQADPAKYDISIYWLDESANSWIKLDNIKVDSTAGTISGDVNHFTKFAVIAVAKSMAPAFKDISGHWASESITRLVKMGAITGYPDGTFRPDSSITRAEFATVLVKAFKLEPRVGKLFADTASHWAKNDIATATAYGIVSGYSESAFGPDDLITREQMAAMIFKATNLTASSEGTNFTDSGAISGWARDAVAAATSQGIMKGYPDNTFRPKGNATRAEAMTVIANSIR